MHHLDSWINIDQVDVTCFIISLFTAQRVPNVSTSIFRSLRLIVDLFHGLYSSGSMCVGVTVWFGWGGVVSLCRLKHYDTTPSQPNHTVTPTHIEPEQYNTWNKSTISRNLLKMDVLTFDTCWAVNSEIIKQVTSSSSIFIQLPTNGFWHVDRHDVSLCVHFICQQPAYGNAPTRARVVLISKRC